MIIVKTTGDFTKTTKFLNKIFKKTYMDVLNKYGKEGVKALSSATPVDTGKTAGSWGYTISHSNNKLTISWTNSNVVDGVPIALVIQYGHVTKQGIYIMGRDYINPAIQSVFDNISKHVWKEITT